jgi:Dolichyl-phosphate-mannose-protein mannosyltransferase
MLATSFHSGMTSRVSGPNDRSASQARGGGRAVTGLAVARVRPADRLARAVGLGADQLIVLAVVLAIAAAFRFWHVTQPLVDAFSWREASTAMMADNLPRNGWNIFYPEVSWTGPGPSYQGRELQLVSFLAATLDALIGWHDWSGRLVAACFGLVTTLSLHRLTALIWTERHAHAAALCYALMPAAVMIDSSYLNDPAMLALVTLGVWQALRYWSSGGTGRLALALASLTLGILSKPPGLAVVPALVILAVVMTRRGPVDRARNLMAGGVVTLALVGAYLAWAVHLGTSYPPYHVAGAGYIWNRGLSLFLSESFYLPELWHTAVTWFYGYPFLFLFTAGLWAMPAKGAFRKDPALVLLPLMWLLGGLGLYVVAAGWISKNLWNLHVIHVPMAIFCGRAVVVLLGDRPIASVRGAVRCALTIGTLLAFATVPLVSGMKRPYAEDSRRLGAELARLVGPDEPVVTVAATVGDPVAIYYSRTRGWVFPPGGGTVDWSRFLDDGSEAIAALDDLRAQGAVWFGAVRSGRDSLGRSFADHHALFAAYLDATAAKVAETYRFVIYRLRNGG